MSGQARAVIIGGGAMGVSLAYHLAKLGWTDTVLVEKTELTAGSTWHAAGLCTHFAHNPTIMQMRAHSVRLYGGELEAETGSPVGFHQSGALRITRSQERMAEFAHVRGLGAYVGFDFEMLSPDELREIYPLVEIDGIIGAIHEPLDGYVDPSQATHAMAAGARALGAKILRRNPVERIERTGAGEWRVHAANGTIACEHIVNAAGTWCREIGDMMGVDLPVVPMLHQYLVTDRIEAFAAHDGALPIIRDPEESWYVRPERDGAIIGPYEHCAQAWSVDSVPADFGMELLPPELDRVEHIVTAAMTRIPALGEAGIKTIVNGPITFTPDANPLIGPAFGLENAWLLTGSSMGVMEGGGAGRFLAEWMAGGAPPMDALAIDPRRFGGYADRDYRIAKAVEAFGHQFAIHFPHEERPAGRPQRMTPVHDDLARSGAVFGSVHGWERANWYAGTGPREAALTFGRPDWFDAVARECETVRDAAGIADLSVFAKFEVAGAGAHAFMEMLGANRPPRAVGGVGLTHALSDAAGILSEFTMTRIDENCYYLTGAAAARRQDYDLLRRHAASHDDVQIDDVTEDLCVLAVMGPNARSIMSRLTDADLSDTAFPWLAARHIEVAGVAVRALRVSYVGELGWELHHAREDQKALYDALIDAGRAHGLGPFGAYAMNAMRLEKGYRAWGLDLTSERTPIEAGLGRLVVTEGRSFAGREVLADAAKSMPVLRMALLEVDAGSADPFGMHTVYLNGAPCGLVTSAAHGHRVEMALALAYIDAEAISGDGDLEVDIVGARRGARILPAAPYDPDNVRLKRGGL